ncbi:MAG: ATP-binding cassette domain-containing protein, partial [Desulfovibrio sp.]|nr:ATP-binding cassette domain-containing protein [Desulfovibrio sp.]
MSVMDSVANGNNVVEINGAKRHVAGYLADFLFPPDRLRVPVRTLSGGERNRLLLARLFTRPSNVLVLDEPTNDLDMATLDLLEELLADYKGTVLMVSHDRDFLDNLVTSTFALEGDKLVHEYVGGYTDWLRQRPQPQAEEKPKAQAPRPQTGRARRLSFKEQREQNLLREELDALPDRIATLEAEQKDLEAKLADPELYSRDPAGFEAVTKRMAEVEQEQLEALERWEAVEARLQELADIVKKD